MAWQSRVVRGLCSLFLAVVLFAYGSVKADAAYRMVFKNGTSVEVRSYEDLGDSIRYPRLGGTVTVPKANLSSIEEVPSPPPNPAPPAATPKLPPAAAPFSQNRSYQSVETPPRPTARPVPAPAKPVPPVPIDVTAGARGVMGSFVLLISILAGLIFLVRILPTILGKKEKESGLPYEKEPSLLTAAERSFYGVLCQALDHQYAIFAKVRLGDLLWLPRRTPRFWLYRNKIDRKHVDFVLCDLTSFSPLLVIELDDSSHEREDRQERDAFVDAALEAAGLPILRMPVQHAYTPAELRVQIYGHLDGGTQVAATAGRD
jgi:very-short-patch-repair endonuclease